MILEVISKSQITNMDNYIKWYKINNKLKTMVLVFEDISNNNEYKYTFIVEE